MINDERLLTCFLFFQKINLSMEGNKLEGVHRCAIYSLSFIINNFDSLISIIKN